MSPYVGGRCGVATTRPYGLALARVDRVALPLLAVSSDEVVLALQRAGFTLVRRTPDAHVLTHGYRDVVIPHGPIGDQTLRHLLRTAGVRYSDFLAHLEGAAQTRGKATTAPTEADPTERDSGTRAVAE